MQKITDLVFRNYEKYLREHDELKTPEGAIRVLSDDAKYNHFISALVEGAPLEAIDRTRVICDRQRVSLLEEAVTNISNAASVIGYAVAYFPILCDIYLDDILGEAITHFPVTTPIMTIPHMQLVAKVENSDGTEKTWKFPRAQHLIRTKPETMRLLSGRRNNLFEMSIGYPNKINPVLSNINKRYFIIEEICVIATNTLTDDTTTLVEQLSFRPDARSQIVREFELFHEDEIINGQIVGHIDWDRGGLQYGVTLSGGQENYTYAVDHITANVVFSARKGDVGRVRVSLRNEGWDVNIDVREDFEYELETEVIQDYEDIYNVNLVKTISIAIKNQTMLNRDHDIAQLLKSQESQMKAMRNYEEISLQPFRDTLQWLSPGFITTLFQCIAPRISIVNKYIFHNNRTWPQYLLTGIKAGAALENMRLFSISSADPRRGVVGFDDMKHYNAFSDQKILTSSAIDNDRIYHIYYPGERTEDLALTVLVNLIYKPLYIVEEITDSIKRTFVRSRTALELVCPEACGVTIVKGFDNILSMWGDENFEINT